MVGLFLSIILVISVSLFSSPAYASDIKINEVLVHPSSDSHEWVELYNPDKLDVSQYFIDDDADFANDIGSPKKSLTAIQNVTTEYPYIELSSSMFNNAGDSVVLFDATGNIIDQFTYTKDPGENISLGKNPDGVGDFAVLSSATKGSANASFQATPTVSPTKIPTPTHTPTPEHTLTPTHTPTPQKTPSPMPTQKSTNNNAITIVSQPKVTDILGEDYKDTTPLSDDENITSLSATESSHEATLGASISAKPTPLKKQKTIVKAAQQHNFLPLLFWIGGGACFIVCGILVYWKMRH